MKQEKERQFLIDLSKLLKRHKTTLILTCENVGFEDSLASLEFDIEGVSSSNVIVDDVYTNKEISQKYVESLLTQYKGS